MTKKKVVLGITQPGSRTQDRNSCGLQFQMLLWWFGCWNPEKLPHPNCVISHVHCRLLGEPKSLSWLVGPRSCSSNPGAANLFQLRTSLGQQMRFCLVHGRKFRCNTVIFVRVFKGGLGGMASERLHLCGILHDSTS